MKWLTPLLALSAISCAHRRPVPDQMAFPYGTYQHRVTASLPSSAKQNTISMNGVAESREHDLRVVGLSPVGSTLFRVHEDLCEGRVHKDLYNGALKQHGDKFDALYELVRTAMFARKGENEFKRRRAAYKLSNADAQGIPRLVEIRHPRLDLKIEVLAYTP